MKTHWKYFKYILRHKWYCLKGCWILSRGWLFGIRWLGVFHDWSKFLPSEWILYAQHFYGDGRSLDLAWLKHIHRNKHHWQYWLLREDDGNTKPLDIPDKYLLEMVADWYAAGMAIAQRPNITPWYIQNQDKIVLSKRTRKLLETIIHNFDNRL